MAEPLQDPSVSALTRWGPALLVAALVGVPGPLLVLTGGSGGEGQLAAVGALVEQVVVAGSVLGALAGGAVALVPRRPLVGVLVGLVCGFLAAVFVAVVWFVAVVGG